MLTSALESLYRDRLKPLSSYLKGRLKEKSCPEPLVKSFVELYTKEADLFQIQPASETEEIGIFFVQDPVWFKGWVDIDATDDPYDEGMWSSMEKFLEGEHSFAGGRYGMARELQGRNLQFLSEYSLGE